MKKIFALISIISLSACGPDYSQSSPRPNGELSIKVLAEKEGTAEIPSITVLCIDDVKYIMTGRGGISIKFQANENSDPSAEECSD